MSTSIVVRRLTARILLLLTPFMATWAQTHVVASHVVPITELRQPAVSAADGREASLARLDRFFSEGRVAQGLHSAKLDGAQVRQAVALLSDEELGRMTSRADKIQSDLAAGALSNQELTYIVIALATAV